MIEIEMKFPAADFGEIERRLAGLQATARPPINEADHYFNAPDRDFGRTDEAFRLRRVGAENRITYKGPKQPGPTKTRTEIELGLEPGPEAADRWCALVQHLGYRPVAIVRKRRAPYHLHRDGFDLEVCCDAVEQLGHFVEVEIVAPPEQKEQAQAVLLQVVAEMGLGQAEPRAYLQMLLTKLGQG